MLTNAQLEIYNVSGEEVNSAVLNNKQETITLNSVNLASGIYLIRVTEDNKIIASLKLVIMD